MDSAPQGLIEVQQVLKYLQTDRYMPKVEAAKYLGFSTRSLEVRKDIPRFQLRGERGKGGKVLFKKSELDRWMENHRVSGNEQKDLARIAEEALQAVRKSRK